MPDETTTPAAPAATPVTTPAPAATHTTPEPLAGDGSEQISLEEARKLRSEAQSLRKRMKAYEDAEEAKRVAALDDVERSKAEIAKRDALLAEADARTKQYQQQLVTAQVKFAAQARGIDSSLTDLTALALSSKNEAWSLEIGEDGMPSNLEKALDTLIKNKPSLMPLKAAEPSAEPPATPAQTATPALPAMNPGRTSIQQPGTLTPGKPMRLSEVPWSRQKQ